MAQPHWLLEILSCPETREPHKEAADALERRDGKSYPIIKGIPSLFFPAMPTGEDARWHRFYDWFAPVYELKERIFGRIKAGVHVKKERARIVSILGLEPHKTA